MKELKNGEGKNLFELKVLVTGSHLSREFGGTSKLIEQDGFEIDWKVDMLLSSDTDVAIAKSMGLVCRIKWLGEGKMKKEGRKEGRRSSLPFLFLSCSSSQGMIGFAEAFLNFLQLSFSFLEIVSKS
jgi:hypothetical protein